MHTEQFWPPVSFPSVHPQESTLPVEPPASGTDAEYKVPTTAQDPTLKGPAAITFRHSGWNPARLRVIDALIATGASGGRIDMFRNCGGRAYVMESIAEPGNYRIACAKCHDRFCKPCARERAGMVSRNLLTYVEKKRLRFVTLTLKTHTEDLREELGRLFSCFAALRKRAFWKRHVVGGAALLEVKHNESSNRWHPHFHILVEGSYIPHAKLKAEWLHVTGDSSIVDVRAVTNNARITHYITKYATDPVDKSIQKDVDLIAQAIDAFRGRKSCTTFGSWKKLKLTEPSERTGWVSLRSLNTIIDEARRGIEESRRILNALWCYAPHQSKGDTDDAQSRAPPPIDPTIEALATDAFFNRLQA